MRRRFDGLETGQRVWPTPLQILPKPFQTSAKDSPELDEAGPRPSEARQNMIEQARGPGYIGRTCNKENRNVFCSKRSQRGGPKLLRVGQQQPSLGRRRPKSGRSRPWLGQDQPQPLSRLLGLRPTGKEIIFTLHVLTFVPGRGARTCSRHKPDLTKVYPNSVNIAPNNPICSTRWRIPGQIWSESPPNCSRTGKSRLELARLDPNPTDLGRFRQRLPRFEPMSGRCQPGMARHCPNVKLTSAICGPKLSTLWAAAADAVAAAHRRHPLDRHSPCGPKSIPNKGHVRPKLAQMLKKLAHDRPIRGGSGRCCESPPSPGRHRRSYYAMQCGGGARLHPERFLTSIAAYQTRPKWVGSVTRSHLSLHSYVFDVGFVECVCSV